MQGIFTASSSAEPFNFYGFIIGAGMIICIVLAYFSARKRGYYSDVVFDIAIICIPLAIIGARLYYVIFDILGNGGKWTFTRILGLEGDGLRGLAIYGGLIGASIGAVIIYFWKRNKQPKSQSITLMQLFDLGFTFVILGQAIGRWGNFFNQEAFGPKVGFSFFPITVEIDAAHGAAYGGAGSYLATFFYESLWNFIGFGFLYWLYNGKRKSFDGFILSLYCIYYGIGRTWIEQLRMDSLYTSGGFRVSQLLSVGLILLGAGIIIHHIYKSRKKEMKPFIFVDESLLDESYYTFANSILHHPNIYTKGAKPKTDASDDFYSTPDGGFTAEDAEEFYASEKPSSGEEHERNIDDFYS